MPRVRKTEEELEAEWLKWQSESPESAAMDKLF